MNLASTKAGATPEPAAKYTYASGARPLDGYTIKRGVGHGGFGEVYYATSDGGKEVALKLIRRNLDIELRGVQQCLNLKHSNLLTLYDIRNDSQGDTWVVMEFVRGDCLENVLAEHPSGLVISEALDWFRGLCAAVAHLHDQGIVHRDLKPGNVFREHGTVKLGDYGLSKFISVSRRSGQTESVGTVHYMAPEIANGRYGKEIDIYALGIVLYELVTGRVPFDGESVGEVLMKHLTAEPDLRALGEPYRGAVAACLAKDPARRPQSVADLLAMVEGRVKPSNPALDRAPAESAAAPLGHPPQREARPAAVASRAATGLNSPPPPPADDWWSQNAAIWKIIGGILLVSLVLAPWPLALRAGPPNAGIPVWSRMFLLLLVAGVAIYLLRGRSRHAVDPRRIGDAPTPPAPPSRIGAPQRAANMAWRQGPGIHRRARLALPVKTPRERAADLLGSLLLATVVAFALAVVMIAVQGFRPQPEYFAWLVASTTIGAWLVLIPSKFWEGADGDAARRRFVMMLAGLGLGLISWIADQWLMTDLNYVMLRLPPTAINAAPSDVSGQPSMLAYLAYFGLLYAVVAWWRQADPLRPQRLSLGTLAATLCFAFLIHLFCQFPQPSGLMVAAGVSLSVQLSSPWINRRALSS